MNRAVGIALIIPATAALIGLSVMAFRIGDAETLAYGASREIETWSATRSQPGIDTWLWVRADLQRAAQLAPRDPSVQELLGVLHARRSANREFLEYAEEHFAKAVELRPSSPYSWANLAVVRYELGKTDANFEQFLARAEMLGPSEPEVQRAVVDLGLALWDEVKPATRTRIEHAIAAGMRRNPMEILNISERRGRLEFACGHVERDKRIIDPKWVNRCEGRRMT